MSERTSASEIASWPVTIDVPTAGRALGLGRDASYQAARRGELPGCIRIGSRYVVVTQRLREALGLSPPDSAKPPGEDSGGRSAERSSHATRRDDEARPSLRRLHHIGGGLR